MNITPAAQIPVQLSDTIAKSLETLMVCLREDTIKYYKAEIAKIDSKEYMPTIKKLIRHSEEFKARKSRHISPDDVAAKKEETYCRFKRTKT